MKIGIMNHCNVCGQHVKPSKKIKHFQQRHPEYGVYVAKVNGKRKMFCSACKVSISSLEYLIDHYKRMHMGGHDVAAQAQVDSEADGKYTQAQRAGAVKALKSGVSAEQVAAMVGAPKTTITRWQAANRSKSGSYHHLNDDGSYNLAERHEVNVSVRLPDRKAEATTPKEALRNMAQAIVKVLADYDAKDAEIVRLKAELLQANRMVEKWKLTAGNLQEQMNRTGG